MVVVEVMVMMTIMMMTMATTDTMIKNIKSAMFRKRMGIQPLRNEGGYIFAVTAMVVVIIISLILIYLRSTVMLNISEAGEMLSTSQAYWSAVSGMEYVYEETTNNNNTIPGTYSYYNSTVTLTNSLTGSDGGPLTNGAIRYISTGIHDNSKRVIESNFDVLQDQELWPLISVIMEGGSACGECDGKVTQLTMQYNGSSSALITVKQKNGDVVYNNSVSPGGIFTFYGTDNYGTFGTEIKLYIDNSLDVKIHTSCSQPIGAGMVVGSFEIISGYSRNGGLLCEYSDDDDHGDDDHGDDDSGEFIIKDNTILNCSIFIGGSVDVESGAVVGSPVYGGPTIIYVPTGFTVTGDFNATFDWAVYPNPTPTLPNFNHSPYDSLISIAEAITNTGGNKYKGNLTIKEVTFDLSGYTDRTYFVKGDIEIEGSTVTGAGSGGSSLVTPGILVASGKIEIKKEHDNESFIDDNVILIAKKEIKIEDHTQVGNDLSGVSPPCRTITFNEVYSKERVEIKENAEVWAIVTSRGELNLNGALYGIAFVPDNKLKMDHDNAYLEGAIFVKKMDNKEFKKGRMKLTHCFPFHYFSTQKFVPVKTTLKEI